MIIKIISKISIFSLIGMGLNILLVYTFLSLWIHPQVGDIEMIFNLSILISFEFVMAHSGVFMSVLGRSWKTWLFFIVFYGLFALVFNAMVSDNQILILYALVVMNRMLPKILNKEKTDKTKEMGMSAIYAMIYFASLMITVLASSHIPQLGLTKDFFEAANSQTNRYGGLFINEPHVPICLGALYYLMLTLVDVLFIIRKIKHSITN
jgi:hypothetical protein